MHRKDVPRVISMFFAVLGFVALGASQACAQAAVPAAPDAPITSPEATVPATLPDSGYRLGAGDQVRINVFGQTDLDGDYVISSGGDVELPLIGLVRAAGLTVNDFQKTITAKLQDGFLVNPSVSVEVVNYRPFYIIGEVNKPGEYPYISEMSVLNAVALAGGYTTRADDSEVYIRRNGSSKEKEVPADDTTKVNPGDIIRVPERFF